MNRITTSLKAIEKGSRRLSWPAKVFILGIVVLIALVAMLSGVLERRINLSDLQLVTPEARAVTPNYRAAGEVMLYEQRVLVTRTGGTVEAIHVTPGSKVAAGAKLVTLTNPDSTDELAQLTSDLELLRVELAMRDQRLQLDVEKQQYALELAQATTAMEASKLESESILHDMNIISEIDYNIAKLRFQQAEIELKKQQQELYLAEQELVMQKQLATEEVLRLERQLARARQNVEDLRMTAPAELTVLELDERLSLGASFEPAIPMLRYFMTGDLAVRVRVPPELLSRIELGQAATLALNDRRIAATVQRLGARVEGGAVPVWLRTETPLEQYVTEGQDVAVELTLAKISSFGSMRVPSWYRGPGRYEVYCFAQTTLRPCVLELGYSDGEHVEIINSLEPGVRYEVSQPQRWLGSQIREVEL